MEMQNERPPPRHTRLCSRRPQAGWLWPAGAVVVLLTGGRDKINNEQHREQGGSDAYLRRLWAAVPPPRRPTTAILHLPAMGHRPTAAALRATLPPLVDWAAGGLQGREARRGAVRRLRERCRDVSDAALCGGALLVTHDSGAGGE